MVFRFSVAFLSFGKRFTNKSDMEIYNRKTILKLFLKSVAAVNPAKIISENVMVEGNNLRVCFHEYDIADKNIYVIGFGKAVLGMAAQCEKIFGKKLKGGVICVPKSIQYSLIKNPEYSLIENSVIQVHYGAEDNLPDEESAAATDEIISLVHTLKGEQNHLVVLISGGGSALFTKPKCGISLSEKRETIKLLMESGADIKELNTVRRRLSLVKGGGLAALLHPIPTTTLIISDVIGDPLNIIASGPTVPCSDSDMDAFNILKKYNLENKVPLSVLHETRKIPEDCISYNFNHVQNYILANNTKALEACKVFAECSGLKTVILTNQVKGDVENVSNFYSRMIFEVLNAFYSKKDVEVDIFKNCNFSISENVLNRINYIIKNSIISKSICIIAGGETTVRVKGDGKGGRNQELALLTSVKVDNLKKKYPILFRNYNTSFLFAGTDGQDGPTDVAGALGIPNICTKADKYKLNISEYLLNSDSYNFLKKIDVGSYLIKTGHTGTNVMDIHIFLISQVN